MSKSTKRPKAKAKSESPTTKPDTAPKKTLDKSPPKVSRRGWLGWALGSLGIAGVAGLGYAWWTQKTIPAGFPMWEGDHELLTYRIANSYPHDERAFTQGLIFHDGQFYEGTGLYGESQLRKVTVETGQVTQRHNLPSHCFGEGITLWQDKIIQLTWVAHPTQVYGRHPSYTNFERAPFAYVYDKDTFRLLRTIEAYPRGIREAWGLTHDGEKLILSDGSMVLYYIDPESFRITGEIRLRDVPGKYLLGWELNELEFINGAIYANVFQEDFILRIDPRSQRVTGVLNLRGLRPPEVVGDEKVLNGIAHDSTDYRLFVTGKQWPTLFEIEIVPV